MQKEKQPKLIISHMSKAFGIVKAVQDVSLEIFSGEIRGLIGENGSGKSTLSAMICGSLKPDEGSMVFNGEPYRPTSVIDARNKKVAILLQERGTIDGMTVAENMFVGLEDDFRGKFGINVSRMEKKASELLQSIGANHISPHNLVDTYKFEDRKLVEVARALYTEPELLIVDETTSALSMAGREAIYSLIENFKKTGRSVIFIGHDLDEILRVCDTATVLKDGRYIDTLEGENMNVNKMRSLMIGRENLGHYYREDFSPEYEKDQVVLQASDLNYGDAICNVSLELHKREILGICGLSDSGMHDLAKALFGACPLESGNVTRLDTGDEINDPVEAVRAGVAYLPKDRDTESLFLQASVRDNISITCLDYGKKGPLINKRRMREIAQEEIEKLNLKCSSSSQMVAELSGGNKQKVVVAKWLAGKADILIMDCPTRGIDVGVKAAIYDLIRDMKKDGKSIVMLSEEMTEVIGMADRILVIKNGAISGEFIRSSTLTEHMIVEKII